MGMLFDHILKHTHTHTRALYIHLVAY